MVNCVGLVMPGTRGGGECERLSGEEWRIINSWKAPGLLSVSLPDVATVLEKSVSESSVKV